MPKTVYPRFILLLAWLAFAVSLSGTRTIGPTGDYASITAAIADIQAQTLGGALVPRANSPSASSRKLRNNP